MKLLQCSLLSATYIVIFSLPVLLYRTSLVAPTTSGLGTERVYLKVDKTGSK